MALPFFVNGLSNGAIQKPNDYFRDQQQAAIDQQWDYTSAKYTIKEQEDFGSNVYNEIEVWIDYVVGLGSRGTTNGDDFRQLIFRDINYEVKRGLYYQFDGNYWITYFSDEYASLSKDAGVRRCNNVMRIIDPENGSIFSIPCVVDYDMTSPSVQVSSYILTPNNHATIMVQGNADTLRLFKLNTRYILGGRPFKLLAYQNALIDESISTTPTLLYLDLYLDELHANDDIVNQLADNGDYQYVIEIDSANMELANGTTGSLTASIALNGEEVNRNVVWDSSNVEVVTIDCGGNYKVVGNDGQSCIITATLKGNKDVFASIQINVVEIESLQSKIIIEPVFNKIRQKIPNAVLRTTIMVGFPSENNRDFKNLLSFLEEIRFDHLGAFSYSREEDTPAYQLPHQVREKTKQKRLDILMKHQQKISYQQAKKHIGETMEGYVVGKHNDEYLIRTYWNAPDDVDGSIFMKPLKKHHIGDKIKCRITQAFVYDLLGEEI